MKDEELVKRLRTGDLCDVELAPKAADRIEAQSARIAQLEAEVAAARVRALEDAAKVADKTIKGTRIKLGHVSAGDYASIAFHAIRALKDHPHDV